MNGQDYEKMIYSIAHKYSFGNDFEDLCQQGRIGCMKAMENYDASKGSNNLSSYVYLYIKGEILSSLSFNRNPANDNKAPVSHAKRSRTGREMSGRGWLPEPSP